VHHRRHRRHVEQLEHPLLAPQGVVPVPEPGLFRADEAGKGDQGVHVGQRVVRALLPEPVGRREVFELEARRSVLAHGPGDALRTQGFAHAHEVDEVPAGVAVFPLAPVRLVEVAVKQVPGELVVEAQRVVADGAGARPGDLLVDGRGEVGLAQALSLGELGRDAGDQAGDRMG
jgi:hypothetical protein